MQFKKRSKLNKKRKSRSTRVVRRKTSSKRRLNRRRSVKRGGASASTRTSASKGQSETNLVESRKKKLKSAMNSVVLDKEKVYKVARRWGISNADAAEMIQAVEAQQEEKNPLPLPLESLKPDEEIMQIMQNFKEAQSSRHKELQKKLLSFAETVYKSNEKGTSDIFLDEDEDPMYFVQVKRSIETEPKELTERLLKYINMIKNQEHYKDLSQIIEEYTKIYTPDGSLKKYIDYILDSGKSK
jgi:hypothetical protein